MKRLNRTDPVISSGSMADIAFLLLTFYLLTTVISDQKGLSILLPPPIFEPSTIKIKDRNLFTIQANSFDQLMIEGEARNSLLGVKEEIKTFVLNYGRDEKLSENPVEAVVSVKTDRGTTYSTYISIIDEVQGAYYEIYAHRARLTPKEFRSLDLNLEKEKLLYEKGRKGIPMNISIAEPVAIN